MANMRRSGQRAELRSFALVSTIGAVLAMTSLGRRSLWLDEATSVGLARSPWPEFWHTVTTRETNQSLYFLMLRGWVSLGHTESVVRAMSVLIGVATIPFMMLLGTRLFGRRAGTLAGFLLAINVVWVHFSQETRGYALCLLLLVAGTWLFVRSIEENETVTWIAYGVVISLAAYAHFFAFFVLAAHAGSLLFLPRSRLLWRGLRVGGIVALVGTAPLLIYLRSASSQGIGWAATTGGGHLISRLRSIIPQPAGIVLLAISVVLIVVAVPHVRRALPSETPSRWWAITLVNLWLFVPVVGAVVLSYFSTPVLVARYFSVVLPAPLLGLAAGLSQLPRRALQVSVLIVSLVSGAFVVRWYADGESQDWRGATRYVAAAARQGEAAVFFAPYMRIPFDYYFQGGDSRRAMHRLDPVFPHRPWSASSTDLGRFTPVDPSPISRQLRGHSAAWLIVSNGDLGGHTDPELIALRRLLHGRFGRVVERRFKGITVEHFDGLRPSARSAASGP